MMTVLSRIIVRLSAMLVPRLARDRWREEWLGEIASQQPEGKKHKILRAAMGAPWDALALRAASAREALRTMAAGWRTDIRQTLRTLWHAPGHVATVVICFGIGITITVSVFSTLNALIFGEMEGLADRQSLARLSVWYEAGTGGTGRGNLVLDGPRHERATFGGPLSTSDVEVLEASRAAALSGLAAQGDWPFAVLLDQSAVAAKGAFVSARYFHVLGTQPVMGRLLRPEDDRPEAPAVAVVGYHLWRDRFDAAPNIVGRTLLVGGRPFTVVGVAPPRFTGVLAADVGESPLKRPQLWLPLHHAEGWPGVPGREIPWHSVIGRLAPGVTADVARSRLALDARRLAVAYPDTRRGARVTLRLHGYLNESPVEILTMVAILLSLPLTVLLIGCANVANLQLARATDRGRELNVRFALGASRPQLIRLLTAESAILAILSTGAGWLGSHFILSIAQPAFQVTLTLDRRVFGFAVGLAAGVTLLSGLAPAWWSTRRQSVAVKQAGRAGGPAHSRLRHALVIVQIALSLSLLAISGLFMTSLRATRQEVPPFARNTLVASLDVDTLGYTTAETRRLREEVMVRLASHPLVASLAAEQMAGFRYWAAGDPVQTIQHAAGGYVTPSWFATTGARLVAGRHLAASDSTTTVAVINERLAQQISPDGAAPGTILYLSNSVISSQSRNRIELTRPLPGQQADGPDTRFAVEVVGVVADVPRRPGAAEAVPAVYLPFPADAGGQFTLRVRAPDPEAMAPQIRDVIRRAEPRLVAIEISSAEAVFLREIGALGTVAWSIGGLGLVALGLAAAGLYAVMAFLVSLRRQEFGIRLAMGARPGDVLQLILRQGFRLALAGSLAGFAIALLVALTLRASFVGMSPFDPSAMLPPAAVLMVVTLLASAVPARRASRIDPIRALREE